MIPWNIRSSVAVSGVALVWAGVCLSGCAGKSATPAAAAKRGESVPVVVATVLRRTVPVDVQVIGNVEAYNTIGVKAQIGGQLTEVHFQEGEFVKKDDVLFVIDPRPLQAQVHQAEATLASARAQLGLAQANLARDLAQEQYARAQAGRYEKLFQQGIISREQTEQFRTNADAIGEAVRADKAAVESTKAAINADQAALENARVQLSYTTIVSPINGRTGNLMVRQGNVVKASDIDMVTINQVEPIYVTFSVPEAQLPAIKKYMAAGRLTVIATPQSDPTARETGVLTFVDNAVDITTGTIKLKGTFTNSDHRLWPGQFVRVTLRLAEQPDALVVPTQAIQNGQDGQFVFVVKKDMTVESRPVTPGMRVEEDVVVEKGLESGETVVTEGHLRLAPGIRVQVRAPRQAAKS
jgi:multidrug efflux system membrane fusion protein